MYLVLFFYVVMKVLHRKHFVIIIIQAWIPKAGQLVLGLFALSFFILILPQNVECLLILDLITSLYSKTLSFCISQAV